MSVEERLIEMLLLQDETNRQVFADWRYRLKPSQFRLALLVEAGELADHLGCKWWSSKPADLDQAKMELVDMWHFFLSEWMLSAVPIDNLVDFTRVRLVESVENLDIPAALRLTLRLMSDSKNVTEVLYYFCGICSYLGVTFNWLYKHYVGKAALNRFRWTHSYGSGYQKIWNGREDNEHLTEILTTLDDEQVSIETITALLQERYEARG